MPAVLDDPSAPPIYRMSGKAPCPTPRAPLPADIGPVKVILRDRTTMASVIPFSSCDQVPLSLLAYLCGQMNREIEKGDTYPFMDTMSLETFGPYWFSNFTAVMLLGDIQSQDQVRQMAEEGCDWEKMCLGSFYIKPNYPGRSSHVCNGGFLVTDAARNRGVGRLMGESYLKWAPALGYNYSVFNLVYETNVASCRIWDALGFKRIGRVPGCGNLKSTPDQYVDAIIYGRNLEVPEEDAAAEERFEKIKYYLKEGKYPGTADRAEKSRLRSAAGHYSLVPGDSPDEEDKLMLKGKEVIADPRRQYEIARSIHRPQHGGINRTTAAISDKYHWVRIKETVSQVIRNCTECKEASKGGGALRTAGENGSRTKGRASPLEQGQPPSTHQQQSELRAKEPPRGASPAAQSPTQYQSVNQQQPIPVADMGRSSSTPVDPQLANLIHQQTTRQNVLSASIVPAARYDSQILSNEMDTSEDGDANPARTLIAGSSVDLEERELRNSLLGS